MIDDLQRRLAVIVEKPAVGAQHAQLQRIAATVIVAATLLISARSVGRQASNSVQARPRSAPSARRRRRGASARDRRRSTFRESAQGLRCDRPAQDRR